ncbi:hypothetical protein P9Z84_29305 [Bacillus cereus]|uniref:hypothetical protein n=1 Tax=Bacillus thuringiensis TaxID=1428 RepID=UPI000BF7A98E|nr:hypothetical protein [Bacillus thuringiensis]MEC3196748.1 hypothetical protein [Bacillus cereus]PEV88459.1 hypothetical protein CN442_20905 [Bacillus thuringiensis]PFK90985.1 hypothetical protein COJ04_21560 [Bacillus thuringiensis]
MFSKFFARFRKAPHVRKVLRDNFLDLTKGQYANLCEWEQIHVNMIPIMQDHRLDEGVSIIEVVHKNATFKLYTEVVNKRVIRAYVM